MDVVDLRRKKRTSVTKASMTSEGDVGRWPRSSCSRVTPIAAVAAPLACLARNLVDGLWLPGKDGGGAPGLKDGGSDL